MFKKLLIIIILINCYFINPEVLVLENGDIIDGKIIKMDEDTITVITKNKEIVIDRDKVIHTFRSIDDYNKSLKTENKIVEKGNLVAEWLFNGNTNDTSGYKLHGKTIKPVLTDDRFGYKDSAYEFGIGKTSLIRVDKNIEFLRQQIFSISVWVKIKKSSPAQIINFWNWDSKKGYCIWCWSDDIVTCGAWFSDGVERKIGTKTKLNKDVWYHIACTYDNKKIKLYLNGEFQSEGVTNNNSIAHINLNEAVFYIGGAGSNDSGNSYQFFGCIDDIRFYDYAISEEEVKKLYHENGWPKL